VNEQQTLFPAPDRGVKDKTLVGIVAGGLLVAALGAGAGFLMRGPSMTADAVSEAPTQRSDSPARKPAQGWAAEPTPVATRPAATCDNCGTVEGVRSYQVKGEGSGLGAVAGGVVGGVIGNQIGGGNGKKAMTVVGAIGGGMAGHEIEKRSKSYTMYEVRVKMDDGSTRTVNQSSAPTPGSRVVVEGSKLRSVSAADTSSTGRGA
jgi:outer membrane lipoprotein SlyB